MMTPYKLWTVNLITPQTGIAGHGDLTAFHLGSSIFAHHLPAAGIEALAVVAPLGSGVGLPAPHLKVLHPAGVQLVLRQLEGVYFRHLHCIYTWCGCNTPMFAGCRRWVSNAVQHWKHSAYICLFKAVSQNDDCGLGIGDWGLMPDD